MEMRGIEPLASRMRIERSTTELHPHRLAVVVCLMRDTIMRARLAEWSKAWDLSSHNRKIAWVRTPHLAWVPFANRLQWRNRLAHGTYRQYKELCRGCEFEPHLEQQRFLLREKSFLLRKKIFLPDRESNPGLPRDRRRSSPLDYRGIGGCWPRTAPEELIIVTHQCHPKKSLTQLVGFEPTLPEGNWFRVSRLNHSATTAALLHCNKVDQHRWFSGRMLACHAGGPGSIPGRCNFFLSLICELIKSGQIDQIWCIPTSTNTVPILFLNKEVKMFRSCSIPEETVFKATESCMDESQLAMAPTWLLRCRTTGSAKNLAPCSLGKMEWVP